MSQRHLTLLCVLLLAGCILLPGCNLMYKQNIQQGNALEQEDLDQLELGMTKSQVSFLLGTPAIADPFHHDRWDYISTFSRRGGDPARRQVTLTFENDALASMTGISLETGGEVVLTEDGTEQITAATGPVGVTKGDARDYDDLEIFDGPTGYNDWGLQLGSFATREEAEALKAQLEGFGYEAKIFGQVVSERGFFIVRTGAYASREDAIRALAELRTKTGLKGYIVSPGT